MQVVYVTIGVPACGKSRFYGELGEHEELFGYKRAPHYFSSDKIRGELYGDESAQIDHARVFSIMAEQVEDALKNGHDVYVDATNIRREWRSWVIKLAEKYDTWVCGIIFRVPFRLVVERDKKRNRTVGWWVILKQFMKFQEPKFEEGFDSFIWVDSDGKIMDGAYQFG